MDIKSALKKFWSFLWEQDSILSWTINVVLAFVIIKFLIYPGLGLILGTPAPIVAVVSGSMEHDGNFDFYWNEESCCENTCSSKLVQGGFYDERDISSDTFRSFPFVNGFNKGDIMILYSAKNAKVGDVLVYDVSHRPDPIIHRIIDITVKNGKTQYRTKGDHNCGIAPFERDIPENRVVGKAVWRVPFLGWVKIAFVELINLAR